MNGLQSGFLRKFVWTVGTFIVSAGLRFGLNIVLAYLLAPAIMGVMVIVQSVRLGIDLLTDVGIEQNIIHHPDGLDRRFRDTAWTLQLLRGAMLSGLFLVAAPFLAQAYGIDPRIFLLVAIAPFINGAHSTAIFMLVKQLEVRRRNMFELGCELLAFIVQVALAYWLRSVWAPAIGLVAAGVIRTALSYRLPDAAQSVRIDREVAHRIVIFGRWIALTSIVMYAATYLDRLYLGKVVPLALLGIYSIARGIAELPTTLARRMSYQIIFPALAGEEEGRPARLAAMAPHRLAFTLVLCGGLGLVAGVADIAIGLVYDARYVGAGWMLTLLLTGGVFAVLSNLNEALLLGAGKPLYSGMANALRLATLAALLPTGLAFFGFPGAVAAVATTEMLQYLYICAGLRRVRITMWRQDSLAIVAGAMVFLTVLGIRHMLGLGSPWAGMAGAMR